LTTSQEGPGRDQEGIRKGSGRDQEGIRKGSGRIGRIGRIIEG
jgi:hypothetical protein